ncbi:hypothetical protein [Lentibacillus salicampi]|uniref:hypothetical protein n=1 Tax=Lentibacillus salicampi TaxID=175306 RepID=UPI001ADD7A81|nr:hypothetical protein [Lentibacillus salicampi]
MARNVTQYELLISCPSDVSDELDIIKETVEDFNRMYGAANNASITTKHWSKDSYPQSGGKPQELLNNQFVRDCDAAVAVFWTRFGTPTDKYGSGTEEEIEELINSNKQVFLYFSDRQINPSSINNSQYEKVQTFRKKYGDKSIYATYSDLDQFKKIFLNHLSLHFVDIFNNGEDKDSNTQSSLSINGVKKGKITEQPYALQADFLNTGFVHNMKNNIMKKIKEVEHLNFPKVSYQDETIEENEYPLKKSSIIDQGISSKLSKQLKQAKVSPSLFETEEVYIGDFEKKSINKFALEK